MMKKPFWSLALFAFLLFGMLLFLSGENASQEVTPKPKESSALMNQAPSVVEIDPVKQQRIGIKKADVQVIPFGKVIRTVGKITYDERKLVTVNLKVEGWIEKLYADYQGKYVKKGEKLAEIYSPELVATQLEFVNLLNWKADKAHRFQRNVEFNWGDRYGTTGRIITFDLEALFQVAKQKLLLWEISEEQIQKIEETKSPVRILTLSSPINGYIIQKQVVEGTRVLPGDKIFDIADLSTLWVIADIYSYELPLVKPGQMARIQLSHFPGRDFLTKIDYVYPTLSNETRTTKVRFILSNSDGILKPQMFTDVEIKIDLGKRLAIPEEAVIDTGTKKVVYLDQGEGYFEPREVTLGLRGEGLVEVTKGLKAGQKVVSEGNFLIDSEAKLKGVIP